MEVRTTQVKCRIVSKKNATPQRELELNATLIFSLSNASFSKNYFQELFQGNYCTNDILTLSPGINFLQLIQIDIFYSHL